MALIFESKNFTIESHEKPELDRLDGGHIKINPKTSVVDRTCLTPQLAIELMRLTIVAGKALVDGMKKQGINIGRVNYQDNGNWKPELHIHLYGRAVDATQQKFGDPITPGHKDTYESLTQEDIHNIREEILRIMALPEFQDSTWGL
ncbi:MAG: HIT domain-containing protein [Patescibacteria group bacterium]